jgi:hypothetical protein
MNYNARRIGNLSGKYETKMQRFCISSYYWIVRDDMKGFEVQGDAQ